MALKDTEIKHAKPQEKPYKLFDGGGLYLLVNPSGSKYWRYKYRTGGKEKVLAIGVYPAVNLAQARERHRVAQKQIMDGIDPGADKKARRKARDAANANTFKAVATKWHAYWKQGLTERYADHVWTRLEADVLPAIGEVPLADLTAGRFEDLVQQIEKRGAADIAKRTLQTCKQIMRYAVTHDIIKANPAADIQPRDILPKRKKRNYPRVHANELPQLLRAIDQYQGAEVTVLAMRFLAYTFVRTGELIRARWEELDLQAKRWNIPAERMKMDRPHIVPLSRQALEVLEAMKGYDNGSGYISDRYLWQGSAYEQQHHSVRLVSNGIPGAHDWARLPGGGRPPFCTSRAITMTTLKYSWRTQRTVMAPAQPITMLSICHSVPG